MTPPKLEARCGGNVLFYCVSLDQLKRKKKRYYFRLKKTYQQHRLRLW